MNTSLTLIYALYFFNTGPLPNTLDDFWRMIWEKRLTTIVMLTQCFEGKVSRSLTYTNYYYRVALDSL